MNEPDVFPPLQEFVLRLEERQAAAGARITELERALVGAEGSGGDPAELERRRAELDGVAREEARLLEAMRWAWRLDSFLRGTRSAVPPPEVQSAVEVPSGAPIRVPSGRPNSKSSRACERIVAALREHGALHRQRLLEILVAEGVLGTEARPINRLATILAENRHLFGSDGRGTYSLVPSGHAEQRRAPQRPGLSGQRHPALPALQPEQGGEGHVGA